MRQEGNETMYYFFPIAFVLGSFAIAFTLGKIFYEVKRRTGVQPLQVSDWLIIFSPFLLCFLCFVVAANFPGENDSHTANPTGVILCSGIRLIAYPLLIVTGVLYRRYPAMLFIVNLIQFVVFVLCSFHMGMAVTGDWL